MKNKMKKDYRLGFNYGLNPLSNAFFLMLGYSIFAVLFLYNKPTVLIISIFCVGFTLFILMKLYNKHLSQRYRFKIGIIINTVYTCNIEYIYTNMFSIDDDGTVFIFKKRDKRNPITTVYRKDDDDEPDCFAWLPDDYTFTYFKYNSITDNFENHIFSAEELKEIIFKITENS